MQKKGESLEQNPSTLTELETAELEIAELETAELETAELEIAELEIAELDSPPESGEVPRGQRGHAADVASPSELDPCASFFPTPDCLTDDEVLAFSEGRMSGSGQAAVEWHMGGCGSCQQLVQWAAWCCTSTSRART